MRSQARDEGTDDSDGEHAEIHQVGRIAVLPDDAHAKAQPDEDACRRERRADGESVGSALGHLPAPRPARDQVKIATTSPVVSIPRSAMLKWTPACVQVMTSRVTEPWPCPVR